MTPVAPAVGCEGDLEAVREDSDSTVAVPSTNGPLLILWSVFGYHVF